LHIDTPLFRIKSKGLQSTVLAESLSLVDILIASIIPCSRVALRIFIWVLSIIQKPVSSMMSGIQTLHHTSQSIQNSLRGEVLRRYQVDKVFLACFLLVMELSASSSIGSAMDANLLQDVVDGEISLLQVHGKQLKLTL
jgi:hypothetical protein